MTDTSRPDVPEGDAVEQRQSTRPDETDRDETGPGLRDLRGGLPEADEADALDQYLDAGQDEDA